METQLGYNLLGEKREYIKMSYKKGLKYFKEKGFIVCLNSTFMENKTSGEYIHFVKGCWIFENLPKNKN